MRKLLMTLVMFVSVVSSGVAQNNLVDISLFKESKEPFSPGVYRWNIEPSIAYVFGLCTDNGSFGKDKAVSPAVEIRYRLDSDIEIGTYVSFCEFHRGFGFMVDESQIAIGQLVQQKWDVMALVNYNYRTSRFVELYGGIGFGLSHSNCSTSKLKDELKLESGNSIVVMPRIGVKLRNHLKFSLGYKIQGKADSYAFASIGWTFGMGKK